MAIKITTYYQTKNPCYIQGKKMTPQGIVVHSTGAANTSVGRYVGPADGILAPNLYNNHWNKAEATKCVHAFIGTDKDGNVVCYQTLPWDVKPWGCGKGTKGSYNNSHIQFEICEDDRTDREYFSKVYAMAVELCALLCKKYNLKTSAIVSHDEAHDLGYASNHGDPDYWFKRMGKSMNQFRDDVDRLLSGDIATTPTTKPADEDKPIKSMRVNTPGDTLNVRESAVYTAKKLGELKHDSVVDVYGLAGNGWMLIQQGELRGWVNGGYLVDAAKNYKVKVTAGSLYIRKGPGTKYDADGVVHGNEILTIVEESINGETRWGKLEDGRGWISLKYTKEA